MNENHTSRKLQVSGGSTYVVSLPKTWVETMSLNAGDSVTIIQNDNRSLTVSVDDHAQERRAVATIGPGDSAESIRRKIVAMYIAGHRSIKIAARGIRLGPGQISAIRNFVRSSMIGTEIVESNTNYIVMQTLTRLPELDIETAIRRMCIMTMDMHQEAVEALKAGDAGYAEEVVGLDDEIDRFTFYMLRSFTLALSDATVLRELSMEKPSDCLYYRTAVSRIERIADHAALIAKRVKYLSGSVEPDTIERIAALSGRVMAIFDSAIGALINTDYDSAEKVGEAVSSIGDIQEEMMMSIKDSTPNSTVIKFVLDSIRRSAEYTLDIAEVVMDRNIDTVIGAEPQMLETSPRTGTPAA